MQQALQTSGLTEATLTLIGKDHGTAKSDAWPVLCNPEILVLWQIFLNGEPLVLVPVAKSEWLVLAIRCVEGRISSWF